MCSIRFIISMLISLLIISCNNSRVEKLDSYLSPSYQGLRMNNMDLIVTDTIDIPLPVVSYNMFCNFNLYNDSILYCSSAIEGAQLYCFNLSSERFEGMFELDPNLTFTKQIGLYKVLSKDSIFVSMNPQPGLLLVDGNGKVLNKWFKNVFEISSAQEKILNEEGFGLSECSRLQGLNVEGNKVWFVLSPASSTDFLGRPDVNRHGVYDLEKKEWVKFMAPYEGVLKYKGIGGYYYDMQHPYQLLLDDTLYVTYPVDHKVYKYDAVNGALLSETDISPSVATDFPYPVEVNDDYEKLNKLRRSTPYYGPLYYHSEVNMFSRFYNIDPDIDKGKRMIIIYDRSFNVVCEKLYSMNDINGICPTKDGFLLIPYRPTEEDTVMIIKTDISPSAT